MSEGSPQTLPRFSARAWTRAFVALGSNMGDRARALDDAVAGLRACAGLRVLRVSRWIETAPVGGPPGQGPYLNGVAALESALTARALLTRLAALERAAGRVRRERNGPRTLDLDLLLFGAQVIDEPDLSVPHPRLEERTFVLEPLCEVAPDLVLPHSRQTPCQRLAALRAATFEPSR